jgi:hypothetical protein
MSRQHPDGAGRRHDAPVRQAVFARELLRIGPWTTPGALKRAHQRGVLVEGRHWDWLGGMRVYYVERILPGLTKPDEVIRDEAQEAAERLQRVLLEQSQRQSPV